MVKKHVRVEDTPQEEVPQVEELVNLEVIDKMIHGVPTPLTVEQIEEAVPVVPVDPMAASLVVDKAMAEFLLASSQRPTNCQPSVCYTGQGVPRRQLSFVGSLAYHAVAPGGKLFIPAVLADLPCFKDFEKEATEREDFLAIVKPS